ncbi:MULTISPECIES: isopentenyl-diphosphate Delta-isomerase [Photorhabdus]|uniref:Isopentenyl-diphosphate Delta-isomerase 2 n=1 Tax=Photorhabdus laumondii subsp. laumondii (strain DSM 15139 / CIP 105565 / TT01) TaxID=243265 RepID=IDI2_PHOLL|nr:MULTISPECIES: isopentenyl-diphosphate Delta-isomerase [Photorhabdus]Q7N0A6.1 RecName: Full=Isopentenyl-diphosphate Delta-isomerase 2; Short=IPP isomerase 2; AltName: Full=IPP:DMAPP isomerase 2; AltName: Full=Isopentenyl pyrophosphate isomerase 2 [Photorhabdus laumondii subsp. laumondii TTO1]AXG48891.1 isopentenyl-diphosphate Delta-isomerase [Photorhabdus laumondii subsp. laumondii]KTL61348.1 isopentenyl-diphosphate delta-isomerase [Photorhabdus laumondii subsp. laumondii]NHB59889.1 isopenten
MDEILVLVDKHDNPIGSAGKADIHQKGMLHRAFSIFVFDNKGNLLLQKRAATKYHSAGLWTNSCCGHPRVGEALEAAAHRRLGEEMGFDCPLKKVSSFIYHAILPNNLIEYEYDHVFIGRFDKEPIINLDEVSDYKWVNLLKLRALINNAPDVYTVWFKKIINGLSYQDIEEWQRLI